MSKQAQANEDAGCLFFFGAVIVSTCVGNLTNPMYGWLSFGTVLMVWAIASVSGKTR